MLGATALPTPDRPYPFGEAVGEMDIEAFLGIRDWLEHACVTHGARTTGAGIGFGQADLSIELDGHRYDISIRPVPR